jgi:hypothetical protein
MTFKLANGPRVDLARRRSLRLILLRLVTHRASASGASLTQDELLAAGWPGERMNVEAGQKRVRTAIWTLRKLGLGTWLVTHDDGYRLDPNVVVQEER